MWYDLVTSGWPVNYTTQSITATGAGSYPLASGAAVFAVQAVYRVQGASREPVPRVNQSNKAAVLSSVGQAQASSYEVLVDPSAGTVLRLFPAITSGAYEVEYIAEIDGFVNDASVWYGPARSDTLLTYLAAEAGCRKEGRKVDADTLRGQYNDLLVKVKDSASWIDLRNPPKIRDVQQALRDPFGYNAVGPDGGY